MKKWRRSAVAYVTLLIAVFVCQAKEVEDQVTYDQRQHGDLNVHVHLKDFSILALLDDAVLGGVGQYDYSYDYEYPQEPTQEAKPSDQEKPSTVLTDTSTEASSPTSTTAILDSTNLTTTISTNPTLATESNNQTTTLAKSPESNKEISQTGDKQKIGPLVAMLSSHRGSSRRRCSTGYVRDSRGRCRRQGRPNYYTLQKLPLNLPFGIQLAPRP